MNLDTIHQWIRDLFPKDLQDALADKINEPSSKGRKSSIDNDNVNDIAYYLFNKKTIGNSNQFTKSIKGTDSTPLIYAISNSKFKCIAYIAIKGNVFMLKNPFENDQESPMCYELLYIDTFSKNHMENKHIPINTLYEIFMQSSNPIDCIDIMTTEVSDKLIRKKMNKQNDENFYKSLSLKDKRKICSFIHNNKIDLDINEVVLNDVDAPCIVNIFGFYKFTEYCVRTKNIECFKKYVDSHSSLFDNFKHCHIILPQFKEYYIYAFINAKLDKTTKIFKEHVDKLIEYGFYNELKFIVLKGYHFEIKQETNILKTKNKNIIDNLDKNTIGYRMSDLNDNLFLHLVKMGYRPNMNTVIGLYKKPLKSYTKNFEVLEMIDPNDEPIDSLKYTLANYHPELIKDFIAKYEKRFENNTIESWNLTICDNSINFLKSCEILNVDPKDIIDELFNNSFQSYECFGDKSVKDILFMCIDYGVDVTKTKYLKVAIRKNDMKMAAKLVRAGCTPSHIQDWKSKCTDEMYRTIMNNL